MAVSFDLFGTLVDVTRPDDPAAAVARELAERGVQVPPAEAWAAAYREPHVDAPEGAAVPLHAHVARALDSCGVDAPGNAPRRAVIAAFDPDVTVRPGARDAIKVAREHGPVGVCSNCAVPQLVRTTLVRADLRDNVDTVVSSVACGWRKPDARIFERIAEALDCDPAVLVHVGDADADAGVERVGGHFVDVRAVPPAELPDAIDALAARPSSEDDHDDDGGDGGDGGNGKDVNDGGDGGNGKDVNDGGDGNDGTDGDREAVDASMTDASMTDASIMDGSTGGGS